MAKGRLGKASVGPLETVEVYKNTSGNEASVSIVAGATSAVPLSLRIDDTTDALAVVTTLANEAFDERFIQYDVENTALADPTPVYLGRLQFHDQTVNVNVDAVFEYFDAVANATRTIAATSNYALTSESTLGFEAVSERSGSYFISAMSTNTVGVFEKVGLTASSYYQRTLGKSGIGASSSRTYTYNGAGSVVDPWDLGPFHYGFSMNSSGFMSGAAFTRSSPLTTNGFNETSASAVYSVYGGISWTQPDATRQRPYLRFQNQIGLVDGCDVAAFPMFWTINAARDTQAISNYSFIESNVTHRVRFTNLSLYPAGGQVLYFEYNPVDSRHYLCWRDTGGIFLASFTRDGLLAKASQNTTASINPSVDDSTLDWVVEDISLTLPGGAFVHTNVDLTARSMYVKPGLWALTFSIMNSTAQGSLTYYSSDLKTWTRSGDYFSPYDYNVIEDQTTIRSNSGVVTATKTNILNVGQTGILEDGTNASVYERTGLVLSNNDRIVAYNGSTTTPVAVQVMGYEGE